MNLAALITRAARTRPSNPAILVGGQLVCTYGQLGERVARIEQSVEDFDSLALAGNAYHGVGIPQCIASGDTAARKLAACLFA